MESCISISEAARHIQVTTGARIHRATIWRWVDQGVGGRRLPVQRVGGRLFISPDDLDQFLNQTEAH